MWLEPLAEKKQKKTRLYFSMRKRTYSGLQDTVHLCSESSRHSVRFFLSPHGLNAATDFIHIEMILQRMIQWAVNPLSHTQTATHNQV